jgi:hypothetical protein
MILDAGDGDIEEVEKHLQSPSVRVNDKNGEGWGRQR